MKHFKIIAIVFVSSTFIYGIINWDTTYWPSRWPPETEAEDKCASDVICELDETKLSTRDKVFFIISAKSNASFVPVNARQACGIESAAMYHPKKEIYVLIAVDKDIEFLNIGDNAQLSTLTKYYPNVQLRILHVERFLQDTPMELLIKQLKNSTYPMEHTSDVLRYGLLYKHSGTYLDSDVILLKPLPVHDNYVGAEQSNWIGAGVMNFGQDTVGREVAKNAAMQLIKWFDGMEYTASGPKVITRALFERCKASPRGNWMLGDQGKLCDKFVIFPWWYFYGVPVQNHLQLFTRGQTPQIERQLANSTTLHYWNHLTSTFQANTSHIPFYDIARRKCPNIFQLVGHLF